MKPNQNSIIIPVLSIAGLFLTEYGIYTTLGQGWACIFGGVFAMAVAGASRKR